MISASTLSAVVFFRVSIIPFSAELSTDVLSTAFDVCSESVISETPEISVESGADDLSAVFDDSFNCFFARYSAAMSLFM